MNNQNNQYDLAIIAGPCSITPENTKEIINEIATIRTPDKERAIYGTRVVGLKSRTALDLNGEGMGIDSQAILHTLSITDSPIPKTFIELVLKPSCLNSLSFDRQN